MIGFFAGWVVEDELHVNNVATHQDYRRIGIGRRLMEAAIDEAGRRGVAHVILEVRASNEPAQLLYRELGSGLWAGVGTTIACQAKMRW